MTQGIWDKSGLAAGDPVLDWINVPQNERDIVLSLVNDVDALQNPVLRVYGGSDSSVSTARCVAIFDPVPDIDHVEVLCRFKNLTSKTADSQPHQTALYIDRTSTTANADGIIRSEVGHVTGSIRLSSDYPFVSFATATPAEAHVPGTWEWMRTSATPTGVAREITFKTKFWRGAVTDEPVAWTVETTVVLGPDTSIIGAIGVHLRRQNTDRLIDFWSWGTNGDPAPTEPVSAGSTGDTTDSSAANDSWSALCAAAVATTATAAASDSLSVIANINTSIISAAQASDTSGESPAANVILQSAATGSDSVDALASAAAALSAGAAAGESWTVQAQVVVNLLDQGVASDQVRRQTDSAINAALAEQSAASDQFLAAVNGIAALMESATASDAYVAVVAQLGSIASGAVADDSFNLTFGYALALQSGALSGDAWALTASLASALSEACTADDLLQAKAIVTTRVRAGAVATSRFAIVNAGIRYLVMGSIILRDALNCRVTHKPALNQSVKIKPGH